MPTPRSHESMSDFVHRFMGSTEAERDFPKRKQRVAVAMSIAKRKRKKAK